MWVLKLPMIYKKNIICIIKSINKEIHILCILIHILFPSTTYYPFPPHFCYDYFFLSNRLNKFLSLLRSLTIYLYSISHFTYKITKNLKIHIITCMYVLIINKDFSGIGELTICKFHNNKVFDLS